MNGMTYRELLGNIMVLTEDQLDKPVRILIHEDEEESYGYGFEVESLGISTEYEEEYFVEETPFLNVIPD